MNAFEKELRDHLNCDIHFDPVHKRIYSIDASIYEIEPIGIVLPKNKQDLISAIKIAYKHKIPIIARGAATGITGGCLGKALIIDASKYLNHILEINASSKYAICEPGVVQDRLNEALSSYGYRLGPDTSTGNRATIGGMIANNAAGAHSLLYGVMADHLLEIELILATGELLRLGSVDEKTMQKKAQLQNGEGRIYRELLLIRNEYAHEIKEHFPNIPRMVSGYNLKALLEPYPLNLCKIIAASEGTLGIISECKLFISNNLRSTGLCVVHFNDPFQGMRAIEQMLSFHPIAIEMIDDKIIAMGKSSPSMKNKLEWLSGNPQAVFVAEFEAENQNQVSEKIDAFAKQMNENSIGYAQVKILDPTLMQHVWDVRKSGLGLLLSKRTYSRAIGFLEDFSVAPNKLAPFMERFCSYLKSVGKEAGIYGHVGSGCMHVRPYIDLRNEKDLELMQKMMNNVADMLLAHGGTLSGEHGDGLIRSWLNKKIFGEKLYGAFKALKTAFDPDNLMNPGKIVDATGPLNNLRATPKTKISTFLDFTSEGGFELAVDLCNGNGLCRKAEKTMCPSFQVTHDEYDTTRARAQALRSIITGKMPVKDFASHEINDVLDLCLECKGCKTECPSQVDMAKMKAEFLHHYHKKYGTSIRARLFANIGTLNWFNSPIASIFNWITDTFLAKQLMDWCGIATERPLPKLAKERFSTWFEKRQNKMQGSPIVLMNDTFTEFNHPEIGCAAVTVLEALGYQVIVPPWKCCGRPAFSKGLLEQAKKKAHILVAQFLPYAKKGIPIVGLEPSCLLTLKDEFSALLGHLNEDCKIVADQCTTFDEFVNSHLKNGKLPLPLQQIDKQILVHGHCHQKAIVGITPTLNVLRAIPGANVSEIPSGCCGLAGSFGYEKEHYHISIDIGNLHLFPTIENNQDALIVADGFSCRSQIAHGTQRIALHLAEVITIALKQQ